MHMYVPAVYNTVGATVAKVHCYLQVALLLNSTLLNNDYQCTCLSYVMSSVWSCQPSHDLTLVYAANKKCLYHGMPC